MTAKTNEQDESFDVERFRNELALEIERRVADSLEAWATCENSLCRRAKRCASPDCECIAKWQESLPPLSPEEARAHLTDFRIALDVRLRLGETVTAEQLAEAIRNEKAARRAAMPPQGGGDDAPAATNAPLSPEVEQRVPENSGERDRWIGPRIRRL